MEKVQGMSERQFLIAIQGLSPLAWPEDVRHIGPNLWEMDGVKRQWCPDIADAFHASMAEYLNVYGGTCEGTIMLATACKGGS